MANHTFHAASSILPPLPDGFNIAEEFPVVNKWHFFNHAGVSPIAGRAAEALRKFTQEAVEDAYLTGHWYAQAEIIRNNYAKLINAQPKELAYVKNTSEGLAFVANGLNWKKGDHIIATAIGYPANVYPWMDVAQRFGVNLTLIPERVQNGKGIIDLDELLSAIKPETKLVAVSHVEFSSGFRCDLATIGITCREKGVLLAVDGIQSTGALPVDVQAMNIDFMSADGHKWLLGPEGCGFFYCREALLTTLHPEVGWMNVEKPLNFSGIDFTLATTAKRFECGSYNVPGLLGLGGAIATLLAVGIPTISQRILALTDYLVAGLQRKGYLVYSPRGTDSMGYSPSSGIVSFYHPTTHAEIIAKELEKQKIIIAVRGVGLGAHSGNPAGGRLRASPHFYNSLEQMDQLLAALPSV